MISKKLVRATRDAFGDMLVELGANIPSLVVVDADNAKATKTIKFAKQFPIRFINTGVAEQNMVGVAAGLALANKIPLVSTHAIFLCGRAYEQIRNAVAYGKLNVKLVGSHGGISVGHDGPTHFSIEDIALMRVLPNMIVLVPADAVETKKALYAAIHHKGPVYIRLGRAPVPIIFSETECFEIGRGMIIADGNDVAIIACGLMVDKALEARIILSNAGISSSIVNMHTIKPLDKDLIFKLAKLCGAMVVAEEHSVFGGLGGAITETLSNKIPIPIELIGIQDTFAESGESNELLNRYGLTAMKIALAAKKVILMKQNK